MIMLSVTTPRTSRRSDITTVMEITATTAERVTSVATTSTTASRTRAAISALQRIDPAAVRQRLALACRPRRRTTCTSTATVACCAARRMVGRSIVPTAGSPTSEARRARLCRRAAIVRRIRRRRGATRVELRPPEVRRRVRRPELRRRPAGNIRRRLRLRDRRPVPHATSSIECALRANTEAIEPTRSNARAKNPPHLRRAGRTTNERGRVQRSPSQMNHSPT